MPNLFVAKLLQTEKGCAGRQELLSFNVHPLTPPPPLSSSRFFILQHNLNTTIKNDEKYVKVCPSSNCQIWLRSRRDYFSHFTQLIPLGAVVLLRVQKLNILPIYRPAAIFEHRRKLKVSIYVVYFQSRVFLNDTTVYRSMIDNRSSWWFERHKLIWWFKDTSLG